MKLFALPLIFALAATAAQVLPNVNPAPWDTLLKEFVNQQHLVAYARFKTEGLERLKAYTASLARIGQQLLSPNEKKALLINAYNAFTIQWVLRNYPFQSIWDTSAPFTVPHFILGGKRLSLNEIEGQLLQMGDPRIHAALVCAARSCPPLRREAYVANRLDEQLDDNVRQWLASRSLNKFFPKQGKAEISPIFKWHRKDFDSYSGGLEGFLRKYAPPEAVKTLGDRKLEIHFLRYSWSLNDQLNLGRHYSRFRLAIAWLRNWVLSLGPKYGVDPIIFALIYVGAIPFFTASVAWIIRNLRRRKSVALPVFCASLCFVSAYLYLIIAGKNIPTWVYVFIAGMVAFGIYSTLKKIRTRAGASDQS